MVLLPRKQWTNPLAWAVWKQRQNNKLRHAGLSPYPDGPYPTVQALWYKELIGGSDASERWLTHNDGQDDFWSRGEEWLCTNPEIEISFIGHTPTTTYHLFDGVDNTDRAFLYVNSTNGQLVTNAATMELNGVPIASATAPAVEGEENIVKLTFVGTFRVNVIGTRYSKDTAFSPTPITAIKLTDPLDADNSFVTKFDGNGPIELPIGVELGVELWANPVQAVDGDWSYDGGNSYTKTGTSGGNCGLFYANSDAVPPNATVRVRGNITAISNDLNIWSRVGGVNTALMTSLNGPVDIIVTSGDGGGLWFAKSSFEGTLKVESMQEIPASALTRQNGEPDGSDIERITRKADNSGWTGDGSNEYDYAAGAND